MALGDFMELYNLKSERVKRHLIQEDIAKFLGIKQETYSRYETGASSIPLKNLNKLSIEWKLSFDFLLGFSINNKFNNLNSSLDKKIIAERLKTFRTDEGISQQTLANVLDTTQSTISAYENAKTLILTDFLVAIAKNYNYSIDYLCGKSSIKKIS